MSDDNVMELRDRVSVLWNALNECNELLHEKIEDYPNASGNEFLRSKVDYFNYILWKGGVSGPDCLKQFIKETKKLAKRRAQYDDGRRNRVWLRPADRAAIGDGGKEG